MKSELTRASIEKAINNGAKTVSQVAIAHGYEKPISGGTTKKIRSIVPEVETLFSGQAVAGVAPVAKTAKTVKAPTPKPVKAPVVKETPVKVDKPVKTPKPVKEKPVKVAKEPKPPKAPKAPKVSKEPKPVKEKKVKAVTVVDGTVQRKKPYGSKVYGPVFAEAIAAGEVEFRPFVKETAVKLGLSESQVFIAANVMRIPKHQSNGYRSQDISEKRGFMNLVAIAPVVVEVAPVKTSTEVAEVAEVSTAKEPTSQTVA